MTRWWIKELCEKECATCKRYTWEPTQQMYYIDEEDPNTDTPEVMKVHNTLSGWPKGWEEPGNVR